MKSIKLLPHHAVKLFEIFYLNAIPKEAYNWYNDNLMENNGTNAFNRIASNPNQLIQIVNQYDEICRMCPKNHKGDNYQSIREDTCHDYDVPNSDTEFAKILGINSIVENELITSSDLKKLMLPTYEKFLVEPKLYENGIKMPLKMMFRDRDEEFYFKILKK